MAGRSTSQGVVVNDDSNLTHGVGVGGRFVRLDEDSSPSNDSYAGRRDSTVSSSSQAHKLDMFSGVYVPVILNIFGVILFVRLGWVVGQAGIVATISMFAIGYAVIIISTLSSRD